METSITPIIIAVAIIQLIMIIVFFTMASNISAIRKSIILKDKDFQAKF